MTSGATLGDCFDRTAARLGARLAVREVEQAIQSHPKVREVAVVGAPGPHGDDVVRCVVVARGPCTPEEIVRALRGP